MCQYEVILYFLMRSNTTNRSCEIPMPSMYLFCLILDKPHVSVWGDSVLSHEIQYHKPELWDPDEATVQGCTASASFRSPSVQLNSAHCTTLPILLALPHSLLSLSLAIVTIPATRDAMLRVPSSLLLQSLWNNLRPALKNIPSFKAQLKTLFF